ncbi:hypothetical protein ACFQ3N_17795 [Virgibacillus byunsanensis]|uniref:Rhodanese domain-containing protein n=1 Tax=Virgibacillus byunsanensis TaxID=570945 RepID=A0ABW3LSB3_9BACI
MIIIILILLTFSLFFLYKRYMPVLGIGKMDLNYVSYPKEDNVAIVDTRDYQTSCRDTINNAYCIPLPYLNRYFSDIPTDKNIVVITSDNVGKNLSARILRNKGRRVVGYCLSKD